MDVYQNNDWNCIPDKPMSDYAIFFAITDNYAFAVANVIWGLKQHSPMLMKRCDIIIYSNDITEKNKQLIKAIHEKTMFLHITFPASWNILIEDQWALKQGYGSHIFCKYYGFWLVKNYKRALWLDADVLIRGDISGLFDINECLAWRRVVAWNPNEVLNNILRTSDDISVGNGGLVCFSEELNALSIDWTKEVEKWASIIVNAPRGGHDEKIIACIAHEHHISVKELCINIYNTPIKHICEQTVIVHFLAPSNIEPKPWKSLASYLYFTDWAEYYQKWIDMGGDGPINYTKDDYYKLFGFGKAASPKNPKEYKALEAKYNALLNSKSWKLTAPLRKCAKWFRKLMRKFKKQH